MSRTDRVVVYKAPDGYRWHFQAGNGRILADGGQGYSRRIDAVRGAERVCHLGMRLDVDIVALDERTP